MVGRLLDWTFMFDAIFYQTHHLNSYIEHINNYYHSGITIRLDIY